MKNTFRIYLFAIAFIIYSCSVAKKKTDTGNKYNTVDDYSTKIDSLIQTTNPRKFNGVVLITKNGEIRYSKAYGFSNFEKKTPISLNDNFRIQSNSKQITAVLVLKEVEKRNINIQKSIIEYLPNLKQSWANTVTVEQLLNMSAGIESVDKPLLFKPGTDFHYSNPAYGLLGDILETVTGKKYIELANKLFNNLGMKNTYCNEMHMTNNGLINGYWITKDGIELVDFNSLNFTEETWSNFIPAGGIISNPYDLNIWDTKLHNEKILKTETYKLMVNSNIIDFDKTFSEKESNYGYGVDISNKTENKYVGHCGRGIGFVNIKFYIPEKDVDVIVLENIYNINSNIVYHFEKKIREIVLNSNLVK